MASQLRVNKSENRSGLGTITYTDTGAIVSGIVTANSFSGGLPITSGSSWRVVTSSDASTLKGETNLQFDGTNVYISDNIIHKDDTNTKIGFPAVDTFTVETAGTERLRITQGGDVGINTTTPQAMLDVRGNTVIGIDQVSGNPGNTIGITTIRGHHVNSEGDFARLYFSNSLSASGAATRSSASIRGIRLGDNLGTGLGFWTNPTSGANPGAERLRIDQNGKFHTGDPAAFATDDFNITATGTGATLSLNRAKTGNASNGDLLGAISFQSYPSGQGYASAEAGIRAYAASGQSGSAAPTELRFYTKSSSTGPGASPDERVRINSTGFVGINTNNPARRFHVEDGNSELALFRSTKSTGSYVNFKLGANGAELGMIGSGAEILSGGADAGDFGVRSAGDIRISTGGHAERMCILSDGKVGLGIVDPKSNLHVYGPGDLRIGSLYGGVALIALQVEYSSGYTGTHFMVEITDQASYSFEGSHIVHGSGGSSYGTEVTVVRMQASREAGATNSGDTWRNGTVKYNNNFTAHDQVGLNPGAGSFSFTYDDAATTTTSIQKMSFSASGQGVGVWAKMQGVFTWAAASTNGRVKIKDKDGNVLWDSNP